MKSVDINGAARTGLGKKATRAARKEGLVPGVIYGGKEVVHFSVNPKEVKAIVYTPEFKKAKITLDGNSYTCILKDTQFHPVTDALLHVDFLELVADQLVKVEIPVRFVGTSPGVKAGGSLTQKLRKVKVKTTPDNLVEELKVDITTLELGDSVRVKDVQFKEGMEVMNDLSIPIATIETPRSMRSAETAEQEGTEAVEGAEATPAAE